MAFSARNRLVLLILATVMLTTRPHHFGGLPDASWAVLFLGGFYLRSPFAFLPLMVEAVLIDYIATQHSGISTYCSSPAYVMLLPAYAALWFGGVWAQRLWSGPRPVGVMAFSGSLLASVSLCFLISNGGFYWWSGRVPSPSIAGWFANFRNWYPHFVVVPCVYVGLVALAHVSIRQLVHGAGPRAPTRVRSSAE
jgi:hypothetical protein